MILAKEGNHRQRTVDTLAQLGVSPERVEFVGFPPRREYLELHHRIDIALDTFPYNGHTTSLDALWMGVPVVSLSGETPVSRAGLSQLSNLAMPELVTHFRDDYVRIAAKLAHDLPRLAALRPALRARMQASPLDGCDGFCAERGGWVSADVAALVRDAAGLREPLKTGERSLLFRGVARVVARVVGVGAS